MLKRVALISLLAVILITGCAASPEPVTRSDFEELCQALGKTDGKISKEDLLAAAQNKKRAEKIFDLCEKNKEGLLTVDEAERPKLGDPGNFKAHPTA